MGAVSHSGPPTGAVHRHADLRPYTGEGMLSVTREDVTLSINVAPRELPRTSTGEVRRFVARAGSW